MNMLDDYEKDNEVADGFVVSLRRAVNRRVGTKYF